MQKFIYPNALNSTEAPAVVTCAAHSTSIYYCSPDKSLHPIRFIWAWHAAGIFFYPPVFPRRVSFFFSSLPINGLKMTGRERHIPYNIDTLWSVYLLTQPQISSDTNQIRGARGERRGRGRGGGRGGWCQPQSEELLLFSLHLFPNTPAGGEQLQHRSSAEFIITAASKESHQMIHEIKRNGERFVHKYDVYSVDHTRSCTSNLQDLHQSPQPLLQNKAQLSPIL